MTYLLVEKQTWDKMTEHLIITNANAALNQAAHCKAAICVWITLNLLCCAVCSYWKWFICFSIQYQLYIDEANV